MASLDAGLHFHGLTSFQGSLMLSRPRRLAGLRWMAGFDTRLHFHVLVSFQGTFCYDGLL
jgi:hypothetical protein